MTRVLALIVLLLALSAPPAAAQPRPNIVFVLTDDLTWNLIPYMPQVQQLQREGMTFDSRGGNGLYHLGFNRALQGSICRKRCVNVATQQIIHRRTCSCIGHVSHANVGSFLQATLDFLIISACVFAIVKMMNAMKKADVAIPPEPTPSEKLLVEIRDLLKNNPSR